MYLFALALSVYTVTYSSNSESTKKKDRKSGTSPKRVLAYSFRGIMVLGTVALVAISLGSKASGHQVSVADSSQQLTSFNQLNITSCLFVHHLFLEY